jgi:hypothetical protein
VQLEHELTDVEKHPQYLELVARQSKALTEFTSRQSMARVKLALELKRQTSL